KGLQFQENPIYEQFLTKLDIIKSINKKVTEALQEWRNRPAPIRSIPQEEINAAKVKVEILKQQSQRLQEFLALLENENRCPICKSPVNTKELVANYKNELQETISDIRLQEVKVRDMERQNQRALTTAKAREQIRMKLNKLRSERDTYLGLKMREINLQEILEYQKKKEQNQKLEIQIANLQQELAYVTGLRESSKKMINQLKNTLDDMLLKCTCQKGMQALEAELKVAKEVEDAKIQLDLLKGYVHKQQDIERKRKKLQVIQHVRAVFHSEAVPKILTKRFLNALNSVINNYLDILHVNYSATFQEDGSCLITYKTGKKINEKQISFGEQLMLALSLYLSLNTLKRSLKLLILDEPTIGLDDDHVERVPSLLLNLLREPSLQIICATHEKKLLRAAYQVVELGGTNAAYT
ncbi:MAG: AAA family ATPase, partial [Candidatus Kryptoniota bacterium]